MKKHNRDDFSKSTKDNLAKRAGCACSNPRCKVQTFFAKQGDDGAVNKGKAAHISAAAPGGPRYNHQLTPEQRKHQSNGIWLCGGCADQIDADEKCFTTEMLQAWKSEAEKVRFDPIPRLISHNNQQMGSILSKSEIELRDQIINAAKNDLILFKRRHWSFKPIELNFKRTDENNLYPLNVLDLVGILETFNEITIVAPPGTGKTTMLLQTVDAILSRGNAAAVFIPLNEWSSGSERFFQSILHRHAFREINEEQLKSLAQSGKLALIMDGWNELDSASRKRAIAEIKSLQRDFPDLTIVMSTRCEITNVPISGPIIQINPLTEVQQLSIARILSDQEGENILEQARLTTGVRELVSIPLYLTALLAYIKPGDIFPATKEEILSLFISKHEELYDKKEALSNNLSGFQKQFLTALATQSTIAETTIISDTDARMIVKKVQDRLSAGEQIQIQSAPQPNEVLNTLVSHHLLLRTSLEKSIGFSFQHQQFQEWYASFEVERLVLASVSDSQETRKKLRTEVLNLHIWEEPILFACERMSRTNQAELQALATLVLETLGIDPMLAAEMIYRSSDDLWNQVREKIIIFVERWHANNTVDRAVTFMINTGRREFFSKIWPLISNADSQIRYSALRAGRYFRPSVLDTNTSKLLADLPEDLREDIITEIAERSGVDGIVLATKLTQYDPSANVQASVIEVLQFRRANRFVTQILSTAPDEVWHLLAIQGYFEGIEDPPSLARLRTERQSFIKNEIDPLKKIHMLLAESLHDESFGHEIKVLIESTGFTIEDRNSEWVVNEAYKRYPNEVASALLHRLELGLEVPFNTKDLLKTANFIVEEGPIVSLIMQPSSNKGCKIIAASIIGSKTIAEFIDKLVTINAFITTNKSVDMKIREERDGLLDCISNTRLSPFIQAVFDRASTISLSEICLLLDIIIRHGNKVQNTALPLDINTHEKMIKIIKNWAKILLRIPSARRAHLAKLAQVIERIPSPKFVSILKHLLEENWTRWKKEKLENKKMTDKMKYAEPTDVHTSYSLQYTNAFSAIGDEQVVELMKSYLPDIDFGCSAAYVLKDIWDRKYKFPKGTRFIPWPDFSEVKSRRIERQSGTNKAISSPFEESIFSIVAKFLDPSLDKKFHNHALKIAMVGFSMPYSNKTKIITELLNLLQTLDTKLDFFRTLIIAGEIISADLLLPNIKYILEKEKQRLLYNQSDILEAWLELLPFSDRPCTLLEALKLLNPNLKNPSQLHRVLLALGYAPINDAEDILHQLVILDHRFLDNYEWFNAVERQNIVSSTHSLLNLICDTAFAKVINDIDTSSLVHHLGNAMRTDSNFRHLVYKKYEQMPSEPVAQILGHVISDNADINGILALFRSYSSHKKTFDHNFYSAIKHIVIREIPSTTNPRAFNRVSMPAPELRKAFFTMIKNKNPNAKSAQTCLTFIDKLRDEYGPAMSEARHPDIGSCLPWPLEAGL